MIFLEKYGLWALRGDFHLHTEYSDGDELERVLVNAINSGLDFIVVTDHDRIAGVSAMKAMAEEMGNPIMIFAGCEVTGPGCHLLVYGLDRELPLYSSIAVTSKTVRDGGAYFVAAHPAWTRTRSSFWNNRAFHQAWEDALFDGFELINSGAGAADNLPVISFWRDELLAGRNPPFTAGSDAHSAEELGSSAFTIVFTRELTQEAIFKAVFRENMAVACWQNEVYGNGAALKIYQENSSLLAGMEKSRQVLSCGLTAIVANARNWTFSANVEENGKPVDPAALRFLHAKGLKQSPDAPGIFTTDDLMGKLCPLIAVIEGEHQRMAAALAEIPALVELKVQPALAGGCLQWQAIIASRTDKTLAELSLTWQTGGKAGTIIIPDIEAGKSIMNLPAVINDSGLSPILVELHNSDGILIARTHVTQPVIQAACSDSSSHPFKLTRYCFRDTIREDDVTAHVGVSWSGNALVFDISVFDLHHHQPYHGGAMYIGDSLQLGIDVENRRSRFNLRDKSVFEFQMALTDSGDEWVCDARPSGFPAQWKPMEVPEFTTSKHGNTLFYKFSLPWTALGMKPAAGSILSFNLIVNVNDGAGRRGWIELTPGIGDRKSAADWAWLVLSPPSPVA